MHANLPFFFCRSVSLPKVLILFFLFPPGTVSQSVRLPEWNNKLNQSFYLKGKKIIKSHRWDSFVWWIFFLLKLFTAQKRRVRSGQKAKFKYEKWKKLEIMATWKWENAADAICKTSGLEKWAYRPMILMNFPSRSGSSKWGKKRPSHLFHFISHNPSESLRNVEKFKPLLI